LIFLSAGVKSQETTYSAYVSGISNTSVAMLGPATMGPINTPSYISSPSQYLATFGIPNLNNYGQIAALEYLEQGNALWYSRLVSSATGDVATKASVKVFNSVSTPVEVLEFPSKFPGSGYNGYQVIISNIQVSTSTFTVTVVNALGNKLSSYQVSSLGADPTYIESVMANDSYVAPLDVMEGAGFTPIAGTYVLSGGTDGMSQIVSGDVIGTAAPTGKTGLQVFTDYDQYPINVITTPGYSDPTIINASLLVSQNRGDSISIVDTPLGLTAQGVVDWHNGAGTYTDHQAFNSSYGAAYWSWMQVYDPYNKTNRWVPPSGLVSAVYAYNDSVGQPWYAPAGFKRGRILTPLAVEHSPDQGERDLLYGNGNVINPIVNFHTEGITVWGQRTLDRSNEPENRVNVRRLLLLIRRAIAASSRYLNFEQNDQRMWDEWKGMVQPFLDGITSQRGFYAAKAVMDATTVTSQDIANQQAPGKVILQPEGVAEGIALDFILVPYGVQI
jgi:hypothetical protein